MFRIISIAVLGAMIVPALSFEVRAPAFANYSLDGSTRVANLPLSETKPDPSTIALDENSMTFPSGVAMVGRSHVKLHQNGQVDFESHFHDSGALDYHYSLTWAVIASDGTVFTLHRTGKCEGHIIGKSGRTSEVSATTINPLITQHWAALSKAHTSRYSVDVKPDISGLFDTVKTAISEVEQAAQDAQGVYTAVTTVIAIFA